MRNRVDEINLVTLELNASYQKLKSLRPLRPLRFPIHIRNENAEPAVDAEGLGVPTNRVNETHYSQY